MLEDMDLHSVFFEYQFWRYMYMFFSRSMDFQCLYEPSFTLQVIKVVKKSDFSGFRIRRFELKFMFFD
ncbi:hypothetical protein L6452_20066 [Arctium lappa]|uniref:Uncharacterized protein n=1 Tax=Arctium lappa TaxID=4217 RepID=A0ACB9BAV8_ARCLA|nr:hypothetical protein L6452_20066 [Arctium lappa]